jgi:transposase
MKRETCFKPVKKMRKRVVRKVRRTSYSIEKKREVVNYAEQHDRRAAANHFNLNISIVGRWVRAIKTWTTKTSSTKKKISSGRKALYPEAEKVLYDWIIGQRKQGLAVNYLVIQNKMKEILSESSITTIYNSINNFKASLSWLRKFLKRYRLVLRRRTKISQKLPEHTKELLESFNRFVTQLRIEKSFKMCDIYNMDEMPVWFDMAGNFTVNQRGEKTVHVRGTGNEKNRFTVILTCAAGKFLK